MSVNRASVNGRAYQLAVTFVAFMLTWFAIWTMAVNACVLAGSYFGILRWCLLTTTVLTLGAAIVLFPRLLAGFELRPVSDTSFQSVSRLRLFVLIGTTLAAAVATQLAKSALVAIAGAAVTSTIAYFASLSRATEVSEHGDSNFARNLILVFLVISALYFFGHRPDADDAALLNFAAKAPLTHGRILELDTMVGDGPHPLFLPTYKFHAYDLLVATLSDLAGLEPIQVAHLLLPVVSLLLFACVIALVVRPAVGRQWVAATLFALGLLYANMVTLQSWGMNGLPRFHQNHGPLLMILPLLAAGLTFRWFTKRQWIDLLGLGLLQVCAVGISANGIYLGPAASGLVALAFLISNPRSKWGGAWRLLPTITYPAIIAGVILVRHLALPSEVTTLQGSYSSFRDVLGWRAEGAVLLLLLPLLPLVARDERSKLVAAIYVPSSLLVILNPVGWQLISALTGNLGYRIFWAVPGVFIAGAVCVRLLEAAGLKSTLVGSALGLTTLGGGIAYNQLEAPDVTRVRWHRPGLRVPEKDYSVANRLASLTPANCKALVPERYAVWMTGLTHAPYLIAVERLYLLQYRFTEPPGELTARWALFDLVNGNRGRSVMPSSTELQKYDMRIGLMAMERSNPNFSSGQRLAQELHLAPITYDSTALQIWRASTC